MTTRTRLGNYELLLELAAGGMGTVYVARQKGAGGFERLVVVKRVHRHLMGNSDFLAMLRDEARLASLVRHPNVVPVIDVVESEEELALVMEYVDSIAMSGLLKSARKAGERMPPPIAARIVADALAGLHAAHQATDMQGRPLDIVHRDVSPQNIIVGIDGSSRLIDFGVAKATHRLTETRSGSLKGKIGYMSPEQVRGKPIDCRTDIFAAGVALHEALTAHRLFRGESDMETMRRVAEAPILPPSATVPGIPSNLDRVVLRALERDLTKRYQTAIEFMEDLEAAMRPASTREVGAYVHARVGVSLHERRDRLRELVASPPPEPVPAARSSQRESVSNTLANTVVPLSRRRREEEAARARWIVAIGIAIVAAAAIVATFVRLRGQPEMTTTLAPSPVLTQATPAAAVPQPAPVIELDEPTPAPRPRAPKRAAAAEPARHTRTAAAPPASPPPKEPSSPSSELQPNPFR